MVPPDPNALYVLCHPLFHFPKRSRHDGSEVFQIEVPQGTVVSKVRREDDDYFFTVPTGTVIRFRNDACGPYRRRVLTADADYDTPHGSSMAPVGDANMEQLRVCWNLRSRIDELQRQLGAEWLKVVRMVPLSVRLTIHPAGGRHIRMDIHIIADTDKWMVRWGDGSVSTGGGPKGLPQDNVRGALEYLRDSGHFDGDIEDAVRKAKP